MSNASDFVIENGILKKYVGPGGDVVVPEGVTEIGFRAFFKCLSLTGIQLPKGLKVIGSDAFYNCSHLTEITLPESMERIRNGAFTGCTLQSVYVPKNLQNRPEDFEIENGILKKYRGFGGYVIIPETTKRIKMWAFRDCTTITGVMLPEGIESIDEEAFFNTGIQECSILLPESLVELINPGFRMNALLRMTLENAAALKGRRFRKVCILLKLRTGQRIVLCGSSYVKCNLEGYGEAGFDWEKYDANVVNNGPEFKMTAPYRLRAMLYRMLDPEGMTDEMRECYIALLTENAKKLIPVAEEDSEPAYVKLMIDVGAINGKNRKAVLKLLSASENPEIAAMAEKI